MGTMREQAPEKEAPPQRIPRERDGADGGNYGFACQRLHGPWRQEKLLPASNPAKPFCSKVDAVLSGLVRMGLAGKQGNGYALRRGA